jgi:hypothetical protein
MADSEDDIACSSQIELRGAVKYVAVWRLPVRAARMQEDFHCIRYEASRVIVSP